LGKVLVQILHKTSGFNTYAPKSNFPVELNPLLIECKPYYEKLYKHSIKVETQENESS